MKRKDPILYDPHPVENRDRANKFIVMWICDTAIYLYGFCNDFQQSLIQWKKKFV